MSLSSAATDSEIPKSLTTTYSGVVNVVGSYINQTITYSGTHNLGYYPTVVAALYDNTSINVQPLPIIIANSIGGFNGAFYISNVTTKQVFFTLVLYNASTSYNGYIKFFCLTQALK